MISVSPFENDVSRAFEYGEIEYMLRRADHESVAAIRASDPRASASHSVLARHYSAQSRTLIDRLDRDSADETRANEPKS